MDRRSLIKHAGLTSILATGTLAACGKESTTNTTPAVHSGDRVRWRLASSFPKTLDTIFGAAQVMAEQVKQMSGGRFEISVYAGGELIPPFGVVDGVQQNTIEMTHTAPYYFFGKDPTFAMGCAIPFGLNSRLNTAWHLQGNGGKLMDEFYANYNIISFPGGNTGAQMGGWYRKPIRSLEGIKGLKMRVGGFGGKILERIGGVPQNIPGGEVYTALEKGTIDATEWVGPYDDQKLGFYKVAKYYYYPGWWEGSAQLDFYVNTSAYNSLSAENKAILKAACHYAHTNMQAEYDVKNPIALRELVAKGTQLVAFSPKILDAAFQASREVYAELSNENPNWRKVYQDFEQFNRQGNQWFRFAEASFNHFMEKQRL
jgi:TRAP-type mannitol/chloroaromatic compound transport system substrate-binding protein